MMLQKIGQIPMGHRAQSVNSTLSSMQDDLNNTSELLDNFTRNLSEVKQNIQDLQADSFLVGKKLRFNLNEELGQVVVKIIDPATDKVVREIPSTDMQQLQITIRQTMGMLVNELV